MNRSPSPLGSSPEFPRRKKRSWIREPSVCSQILRLLREENPSNGNLMSRQSVGFKHRATDLMSEVISVDEQVNIISISFSPSRKIPCLPQGHRRNSMTRDGREGQRSEQSYIGQHFPHSSTTTSLKVVNRCAI